MDIVMKLRPPVYEIFYRKNRRSLSYATFPSARDFTHTSVMVKIETLPIGMCAIFDEMLLS